jgi:hypothetical protein
MFKDLRWEIGTIWCKLRHESLMWPVHGHYRCRTCGRHYPAFAEVELANWTMCAAMKATAQLSLAIALATLARQAYAADASKAHASEEAEAALERYAAGGGWATWAIESVEIHASPKLEKTEVLQLAGDRTVKEQVIVRYLKAEERASELPAQSVAVTPADYKIRLQALGGRR